MSKVVEAVCDKAVNCFWERWVLMGSVSPRPLGVRL